VSEPESLPPPLVPDDVDLQDFAFMPLDVRRLRDSDLASNETPEACWAAVLIWAASWHQVPAASVPNNDQWLAKVAGYVARGRIDPAWNEVRNGALRGWVACSDGRLYHPVVAEKALESWMSKLRHSYGRMTERLRKTNKQRAEKGLASILLPTFDQWNSSGRCDPSTTESEPSDAGIPPENALKGQGQGIEEKKKKRKSPLTAMPADFGISESVRKWAEDRQISAADLDRHLASFRTKCEAKDYRYANWDAAFRNAIDSNWAGIASVQTVGKNGQPVSEAIEAWAEVRKANQRGSAPQSWRYRFTARALESMGGFYALRDMTERDAQFKQRDFERAYAEASRSVQ
jgi:hypothetical protein